MSANTLAASFSGAVIFDTNAYRVFTYGRSLTDCRKLIAELREKESASKVTAYAHPIVAWELFAHLAAPIDRAFANCLNSLVAMGEHSALPNGKGAIGLIADTYHTSTRNLFGLPEPRYETAVLNLTIVITHITRRAPDLSDPICQSNIQHLSTQMGVIEKAWVGRMTTLVDSYLPGMAASVFGGSTDQVSMAKLRDYFSSKKFFRDWSLA